MTREEFINQFSNGGRWNKEENARLFDLATSDADRLSSGIIAEKMKEDFGRCFTRNAIIGRLARGGIKLGKPTLTKQGRREQKPKSAPKPFKDTTDTFLATAASAPRSRWRPAATCSKMTTRISPMTEGPGPPMRCYICIGIIVGGL